MCNSALIAGSVLSVNIQVDNNVVLHLCWDNSDLNDEMQTAHGTAIQEVALPDTSAGVVILRFESQATVPTKLTPIIVIKPCNAKQRWGQNKL